MKRIGILDVDALTEIWYGGCFVPNRIHRYFFFVETTNVRENFQ